MELRKTDQVDKEGNPKILIVASNLLKFKARGTFHFFKKEILSGEETLFKA